MEKSKFSTISEITYDDGISFMVIIKGVLFAFIISLIMFALTALAVSFGDMSDWIINVIIIAVSVISILVAGMFASKNAKSKGFLYGGAIGFLYMLVLYFIGALAFDRFGIDLRVLTMLVIGVVSGALGGIIGINLKRRR